MFKNKLFLKIAITIICFTALIISLFIYHNCTKNNNNDNNSNIIKVTIILEDPNSSRYEEKEISFASGLSLKTIIEQNYTCNIENGFLNEINGMKSENIYEYFICLYVNNEVSNFGVADVYPNDGDVIKFKMTAVSELYG